MTLVEFLLARIAEDERRARSAAMEVPQERRDGAVWGVWLGSKWYQSTAFAAHFAAHLPARVLAECEAKRRIVEAYQREEAGEPHVEIWGLEIAARMLAQPYRDHADFNPAWDVAIPSRA